MTDRQFTWHPPKSDSNYEKHGLDFQTAILAFKDPRYIEDIDDRVDYGEERVRLIGMVDEELIAVSYTDRNGETRIISARPATRRETDVYYESNSQG